MALPMREGSRIVTEPVLRTMSGKEGRQTVIYIYIIND